MKLHLSKTAKIVSVTILIALFAGAAALAFPAIASAQSSQPGDQTPTQSAPADRQQKVAARLEKAYQRAQKTAETQSNRLTKAEEFVARAQQRIANLKSQGKDVTALETALSNFQNVLGAAHTSHNSADAILKAHAGFDASGKVTDPRLARDTVQEAAQLLKQVRQDVTPAVRDLTQAIRQFVKNNRTK